MDSRKRRQRESEAPQQTRQYQPYFLFQKQQIEALKAKKQKTTAGERRSISDKWRTLPEQERQRWIAKAADVNFDMERPRVAKQHKEQKIVLIKKHRVPPVNINSPDFTFTLCFNDFEFCVHKRVFEQHSKIFAILSKDCAKDGTETLNMLRLPENRNFNEEHVGLFSTWLRNVSMLPQEVNATNIIGLAHLCEWVDAAELRLLIEEWLINCTHTEIALQSCFEFRYPRVTARLIHLFVKEFLVKSDENRTPLRQPYNFTKRLFVDNAPSHWHKTMLQCLLFVFRERRLGREDVKIQDYLRLPKEVLQGDDFQRNEPGSPEDSDSDVEIDIESSPISTLEDAINKHLYN